MHTGYLLQYDLYMTRDSIQGRRNRGHGAVPPPIICTNMPPPPKKKKKKKKLKKNMCAPPPQKKNLCVPPPPPPQSVIASYGPGLRLYSIESPWYDLGERS